METISKKKKLIAFLTFMAFALPISALTNATISPGVHPYYSLSAKDVNTLKIGATFFSLYCLIAPWYYERHHLPIFRKERVNSGINPENLILRISYLTLWVPIMLGQLLPSLFGLPVAQANYFFGVGILGALVWFVYTLRKNAPPTATIQKTTN
jgi:hypothetical protein